MWRYIMGKYIDRVGGDKQALEVVKYHREYFKNYTHYDTKKRSFCKPPKNHNNPNLVFMNFLIGEVKHIVKG